MVKNGITSADTVARHYHELVMTSEIDGFTTSTKGKCRDHVHRVIHNKIEKTGTPAHDHEIRKLYG